MTMNTDDKLIINKIDRLLRIAEKLIVAIQKQAKVNALFAGSVQCKLTGLQGGFHDAMCEGAEMGTDSYNKLARQYRNRGKFITQILNKSLEVMFLEAAEPTRTRITKRRKS